MDSEFLNSHAPEFMLFLQGTFIVVVIASVYFYTRKRNTDSFFKLREADRLQSAKRKAMGLVTNASDSLSPKNNGTERRKKDAPLFLPGINLNGKPEEILGIKPNASLREVNRAYRDLMKRYHPDKVGPVGSVQWQEAQKFAEAINHARDRLIKNRAK